MSTLRVRTTEHPVPLLDAEGRPHMGFNVGHGLPKGSEVTIPDNPMYRACIEAGHLEIVEDATKAKTAKTATAKREE